MWAGVGGRGGGRDKQTSKVNVRRGGWGQRDNERDNQTNDVNIRQLICRWSGNSLSGIGPEGIGPVGTAPG